MTVHHQTRRRVAFVGVAVIVAAVLGLSSWNGLLAAAANNRLESRCPQQAMDWTYDRSSWTPLGWTCAVQRVDGRVETLSAWW